MDITFISISLIDEDKDQPRYQFNQEALEELANSIKELGLLSPIKVRAMDNGRYKIIYGNRRYKASLMVGLEQIPCIISTATDETDIYFEQIAENLNREDFSPIEEAEAFNKLMNDDRFRSSIKLLSGKLGKTEAYIKNKCELLKFSSAVKKLIVSGTQIHKDQLTEDQLMPLKDLPMEYRDTLALTAARDELPVSDIKKIAKLFKDATISSATKDKLLLKNGPSLIDTWSVYEQNRKEKLAKEKEKKEREMQLEEQRAAQEAMALEREAFAEKEAMLSAAHPAFDHAKDAEKNRFSSDSTAITSPPASNYIEVREGQAQTHLNPTTVTDIVQLKQSVSLLKQEHQLVQQLLNELADGQFTDYDAADQIAGQAITELQLLLASWQEVHQRTKI